MFFYLDSSPYLWGSHCSYSLISISISSLSFSHQRGQLYVPLPRFYSSAACIQGIKSRVSVAFTGDPDFKELSNFSSPRVISRFIFSQTSFRQNRKPGPPYHVFLSRASKQVPNSSIRFPFFRLYYISCLVLLLGLQIRSCYPWCERIPHHGFLPKQSVMFFFLPPGELSFLLSLGGLGLKESQP